MGRILLTVGVVFISLGLKAQVDLYGGVGYGCGPKQVLGYSTTLNGQNMESALLGSLGTALDIFLGADYSLCDGGGVGLELDYVSGITQKVAYRFDETSGYTYHHESEGRNTGIQLFPYAYIHTTLGEHFRGTAKVGPVVNVIGKNYFNQQTSTQFGPFTTTEIWEEVIDQRVGLGFRGSVGLDYKLSDKVQLGGEIIVQNLSVKLKSVEITKYTENGVDMLDMLPVGFRMINYLDKVDESSNNPGLNPNYDPDQPLDLVAPTYNLSKTGFRFAIRYSF